MTRAVRLTRSILLVGSLALAPLAASGSELYTTQSTQLLTIDQNTAATAPVLAVVGSARGLSTAPGETQFIYSVRGDGTSTSPNPPFLDRFDVENDLAFSLPVDHTPSGYLGIGLVDLAIDPNDPGTAIVSAIGIPDLEPILMSMDLDTAQLLGPPIVLDVLFSTLTFGPGGTLFGMTSGSGPAGFSPGLVTIDPVTGAFTPVGDPMSGTSFYSGMAFRPEDDALFVLAGGTIDQLLVLDASTATIDQVVGGFGGTGLAFLGPLDVPEPTLPALLAAALVALALRSRNGRPIS